MAEEGRIPDIREALAETEKDVPGELKEKPVLPKEPPPPPPRDWVSHPITKTVGAILIIGGIILVWLKLPEWREDIREHMSTASLVFGAIVMGIVLLIVAYWRGTQLTYQDVWRTMEEEDKRKVSRRP
jgi:uncharacterized membrane protein